MAGGVRAWLAKRPLEFPALRLIWLVPLAFLPQWFTFFWSTTRLLLSDQAAAVVLVTSQLLLFLFAWANRRHRAFWWLICGLLLNLLVIVLNGGLMPISPTTVNRLVPEQPVTTAELGTRLRGSKDILLPEDEIRLPWLADRFLTPSWSPQRAAFSAGDVLIAIGAFVFLWSAGGVQPAKSLPEV